MTRALVAITLCLAFAATAHAEPRPFVSGSIAQIRAAHASAPYVMALWSLDCPPCHEELATLGAWLRAHSDARLVLISTDTVHTAEQTDAVLRKHGLGSVESWAFADGFVEHLRHEIDPAWHGELPRSYLVDGRGTQAVSGRLDRSRLDAWWRSSARTKVDRF